MAIAQDDVARVRAATDIVALIGEHTSLKRQGRRWVGLCPFHQEKTPSFSVNAEEGLYYCFGCQQAGDAISFVRAVEHYDFVDAVRVLADRAGLTISEDAAFAGERRRRQPLLDAVALAVDFYHQRLLTAPDAGAARDYLRSRGYDGDVVRRFSLGWAPDDWDELARHLAVSDKVLVDAGLGFVNRRGRQQDTFRGRILFPIFDPSGRAIAFGGRILPAPSTPAPAGGMSAGPKYKNSPEGPIYTKRRTLYGLNWAKHDVVAGGEIIVCEGYTDVIACFGVGMPRAVATCGTALGDEHLRLLRNFARRVVLAFDADVAGQAGAGRIYEWERQHDLDVRVAALPAGDDPAELARRDPDALRTAIASAEPYLRFRVEGVLSSADLATAEGRARAAEAALGAIVEHPNDLVRDQYLMLVADRTRLDPASLRTTAERLARAQGAHDGGRQERSRRTVRVGDAAAPSISPGPSASRRPRAPSDDGAAQRPGREALRLAVHDPEAMVQRLQRELFVDERQRAAFDALDEADDLHSAIAIAEERDPAVADLLRRVAVEEPAADADDVIVQLVRVASRRALTALEARARLTTDSATTLVEIAPLTARVHRDLEELDEPGLAVAAAHRLLAWLVAMHEERE